MTADKVHRHSTIFAHRAMTFPMVVVCWEVCQLHQVLGSVTDWEAKWNILLRLHFLYGSWLQKVQTQVLVTVRFLQF